MKKFTALVLVLFMILSIFVSCDSSKDTTNNNEVSDSTKKDETTIPDTSNNSNYNENKEKPDENTNKLNGKKVIFIGNSHTYYGKTVIEKTQAVLTQTARSYDKGYFYQICKNNGAEVAVTNWTFGNHTFNDLFKNCAANRGCDGVDHLNYLKDRNFDYVVMQYGTTDSTADVFIDQCNMVMDVFKEANPDVKFVFLVARKIHEKNLKWLSGLKTLDEQGVIIVDWGKLVDDLITGQEKVPNTKLTYNQNSFIIRKSSSDGYHPNMLTGYITSLMTYCAITDETAEGQDYSFCGNSSVNSSFNFNNFINTYYTYNGATTNFKEIFASESDMTGIQQLIDKYLKEKAYMNY